MDELIKKISKASKKRWAEMNPEVKYKILSNNGKKGGPAAWAKKTKKQQKEHITKMLLAKQLKYGKPTGKSHRVPKTLPSYQK